jgi:hypothetical protein
MSMIQSFLKTGCVPAKLSVNNDSYCAHRVPNQLMQREVRDSWSQFQAVT